MSDAQSTASPDDLFETVKVLTQITHGGSSPEFDLSEPFVQGRRGPYVGVAYKMGLVGRDAGPGPKRRLTEVGALAVGLLKDVPWDEARRTWGDRVRRLAERQPEHAASILPLAGAAAPADAPEPAPQSPAAAALAAKTRTRIGLPTYGILECLEDVRRATQNGERTVVAKGDHSFTRFTSAALFGILRVGEPDTRVLTERGRVLLSGPADPGYRKCLERAFEEQHVFVLIRDEMGLAQRGQPDLKKVAKKIRAYRPDLTENVRMQIARAFASSLALLRKGSPPQDLPPAVGATAPLAEVKDKPQIRPAAPEAKAEAPPADWAQGPQPLRSFSSTVDFLHKMTEGGRLKSFRRSDSARVGMTVNGAYSNRLTAALAFRLVEANGAGEFALTELGDQAATLGPSYAAELFGAATWPEAYVEVAAAPSPGAAKDRLLGRGLANWKIDEIMVAYRTDVSPGGQSRPKGQPKVRPAPRQDVPRTAPTRTTAWYDHVEDRELSARPWIPLRVCLKRAAAIWGPGGAAFLTSAEVKRQASNDKTVGYRTFVSMLEFGLLREEISDLFGIVPGLGASEEDLVALAVAPPVFKALLSSFPAIPSLRRAAAAISAAGFSPSSSVRVARAFLDTIAGMDYGALRAAAGDGGPLRSRFGAASTPPESPAAAEALPSVVSPAAEPAFTWTGGSGRPLEGSFRLVGRKDYDRLIGVLQALRAAAGED